MSNPNRDREGAADAPDCDSTGATQDAPRPSGPLPDGRGSVGELPLFRVFTETCGPSCLPDCPRYGWTLSGPVSWPRLRTITASPAAV